MAALSSSRSVFVYQAFQNYLLETLGMSRVPHYQAFLPFICLAPHNSGAGGRGAGVIMTLLNNSGLLAIIAWMQQTRNENHSDQIDDTLKTFDRSTYLDVYQTFAKEGFYDEHGHYVSWTRVITDIIPVKTNENLFMRRCNIVKRLQKILSQAVTQHFHCRMWGEGDTGTRSPIKLSFIQTSSSLEGRVAA